MAENRTANPTTPCPACNRPNGPARTACLYCGAALPTTDPTLQRPGLRALEEWEHGYNIVSCLRSGDTPDCQAAAAWLNLDADYLLQLAGAGTPLPLVRVATEGDATLITARLPALGWPVSSVSDVALAVPETPAKRVSRLTWDETGLTAHPVGGSPPFRVAWEEMKLFVTGRLFTRQVETTERKGRQGEKEVLDARELSNDEVALDGYGPNLVRSWRIYLNSFDFSCLGAHKTLLARENFAVLCRELRARAGQAVWQEGYDRLRGLLVTAWPLSQRTDARGWQRTGGRVSLQAAIMSSNEIQFTRFSRLCYHLAMRRDET